MTNSVGFINSLCIHCSEPISLHLSHVSVLTCLDASTRSAPVFANSPCIISFPSFSSFHNAPSSDSFCINFFCLSVDLSAPVSTRVALAAHADLDFVLGPIYCWNFGRRWNQQMCGAPIRCGQSWFFNEMLFFRRLPENDTCAMVAPSSSRHRSAPTTQASLDSDHFVGWLFPGFARRLVLSCQGRRCA